MNRRRRARLRFAVRVEWPTMNRYSVTAVLILGWLAAGPSVAGEQGPGGPAPAVSRAPRNAEEYDALFQQVKNWGRWGANDQLGAANLVTDAKRRQAAGLVKAGLTVSLAHNPMTEKADDNASPFEHTMNRGSPPTPTACRTTATRTATSTRSATSSTRTRPTTATRAPR